MKSSRPWKSFVEASVTWAVLFAVYLLLVGSASASEVVIGAALAAGVAPLLLWSRSVGMLSLQLRWRYLAPLWSVPGAILWETGQDLYALARRLAGQDVHGIVLRLPFAFTGDDPESATRRVIAIFGVTITPNSYVVRVDVEKKEILIRQLVGQELSKGDSAFLRAG